MLHGVNNMADVSDCSGDGTPGLVMTVEIKQENIGPPTSTRKLALSPQNIFW